MLYQEKVVVVVGGGSGLGRAAARLFAEAGGIVVVGDIDGEAGENTVLDIQTTGGEARFVACDVRRESDCQSLIQVTVENYNGIDVVYNSVGVACAARTVVSTSEQEWDLTMDTNVKGVYFVCKYAIAEMAKHGGGSIVNTASVWGLVAGTDVAPYCAAKGAVVLLTKAMALDHVKDNIRVNCVCPGSVDTPMLRGEMEALGGVDKAMPAYEKKHPMGRIAQPEEIAKAVLFLASDDASFITGVALPVDGGRMAGEVVVF